MQELQAELSKSPIGRANDAHAQLKHRIDQQLDISYIEVTDCLFCLLKSNQCNATREAHHPLANERERLEIGLNAQLSQPATASDHREPTNFFEKLMNKIQ